MSTIIFSDFSKTFTAPTCPTTWSVFAKSGILGESYTADRNALFEKNHHFELEGNIKETQRWFHEHMELFVKYKLTTEQIRQIVLDDTYFKPREGIAKFLKHLRDNGIPLKIITSGITNFVEAFFIARGYGMEGIEIYGNTLIIENNVVTSVDHDSGIIPLIKDNHPFDGTSYDKTVVIGDNKEDLTIYSGVNRTAIGFTDEDFGYDVKLGKNGEFSDVLQYL